METAGTIRIQPLQALQYVQISTWGTEVLIREQVIYDVKSQS